MKTISIQPWLAELRTSTSAMIEQMQGKLSALDGRLDALRIPALETAKDVTLTGGELSATTMDLVEIDVAITELQQYLVRLKAIGAGG